MRTFVFANIRWLKHAIGLLSLTINADTDPMPIVMHISNPNWHTIQKFTLVLGVLMAIVATWLMLANLYQHHKTDKTNTPQPRWLDFFWSSLALTIALAMLLSTLQPILGF